MGKIANPMWNYQLGLAQGWVPPNPRKAVGVCPSLASSQGLAYTSLPAPTLSPWMTGGAGAGTILNQAMSQSYSQWPPATIGAATSTGPYLTPVSNLPTYTPTASIYTMPAPPSPTSFPSGYSTSVNVGNGWVQPSDTTGFQTEQAGCSYPNPWSGAGMPIPTTAFCGAGGARRMKRDVKPTTTASFQPTPAPTATPFA